MLELLAYNLFNEIGRAMQVGEETIKWHIKKLLAKLNAASRKQVVSRAHSGLPRRRRLSRPLELTGVTDLAERRSVIAPSTRGGTGWGQPGIDSNARRAVSSARMTEVARVMNLRMAHVWRPSLLTSCE